MVFDDCVRASQDMSLLALKSSQRLEYIHVGKTGGSSVHQWLLHNNIPHTQTHIRRVTQCKPGEPTKWLISVRDPKTRFVSSFNWRSPKNGNAPHGTSSFGETEEKMYNCFGSATDFAEALED